MCDNFVCVSNSNLSIPDYANIIAFPDNSTPSSYTAPSNGFICGMARLGVNGTVYGKINNRYVFYNESVVANSSSYMSIFAPMASGDIINFGYENNGTIFQGNFVPYK